MRALILLGFLSLPAYADELQYSLTGTAVETQGANVGTTSPFTVNFDISTTPTSQSLTFLGGCYSGGLASGLAVSALSGTVGSQTIWSNASATAGFGGDAPSGTPCATVFSALATDNGLLLESFLDNPHVSSPDRALTELLSGVFPKGLEGESAILQGDTIWALELFSGVKVTNVSVPEPGMLSLMSLGLVAIWARRRRRPLSDVGSR